MLAIDCVEWLDHDDVALLMLLSHLHHLLIFIELMIFGFILFLYEFVDFDFVPIDTRLLDNVVFSLVLDQGSIILCLVFDEGAI